jgi:hypothetical protein
MAQIICPKCRNAFDSSDPANAVGPWVAATAGGGGGAVVGAGIGLATGGVGMAATIPFGLAGGVIGFLTVKAFRRCPNPSCRSVFKV